MLTFLLGCPEEDAPDYTEAPGAVPYSIEQVAAGNIPDFDRPFRSEVSSADGYTYLMEAPPESGTGSLGWRYLLDTYVFPEGTWCVDGTIDEDGICRGTEWASGRIDTEKPTANFCGDDENGRLFLVKDQGDRIEVVDTALEGDMPYTFNVAAQTIALPADLTERGKHIGPCVYTGNGDELLLTARDGSESSGLAVVTASERDAVTLRTMDVALGVTRAFAMDDGLTAVLLDDTGTLVGVDIAHLEVRWTATAESAIVHADGDIDHDRVYVALGSAGAAILDTTAADQGLDPVEIDGDVYWAYADRFRGTAWFVGEASDGAWTAWLWQGGKIVDSYAIEGTVVDVARPGTMGDLAVFAEGESGLDYVVLGERPEAKEERPPLQIFLFTTIEEPSDAALEDPCAGEGSTFEHELALVKANASVLQSLGVPVAMAISDNFAEKSETCGVAGEIYPWLQDEAGFELGVMLHNRPCYHCSSSDAGPNDSGFTSNPDYCGADDPNYIAAGSSAACFPDDPEYCSLGDWDCYYAFLQPRAEIADRNIPGGANFIVGADRHGMWEYDWLKFYQEVERESQGRTGFPMTLFAGTWAYNNIDYDDPRGKNPTPWRAEDRAATWHPNDVDAWAQESVYSSLLYLPGINSAAIKIGEQQGTGTYMADFFDLGVQQLYDDSDFEVLWQMLRQSVRYRQDARLNTWYFHVHDNGLINLADAEGNDVQLVRDDGSTYTPRMLLEDFIARINDRYVESGEVAWAYPSEILAQDGD
ncbi:MAG: hypothetical protein FJ102_07005 [Deltaproteobacteria bacterium]|nr:hypothetical protein [Deltaproteobacteria bacterium]